MTTYEFIKDIVDGKQTKEKTVSSVWFDGDIVYSYGSHYPLLMPINKNGVKFWVVNDRGYSNTTAKHINYAKDATQGHQYFVTIDRNTFSKYDLENSIKSSCNTELEYIERQLSSLSPRAYKQKELLELRRMLVKRTKSLIES